MGWEIRKGNFYLYRKRRIGRRVVSEYLGCGMLAEVQDALDEEGRERKVTAREEALLERKKQLELDRDIDCTLDLCSGILSTTLIAYGYHTHKGTWRKQRGKR